MGEKPAGLLKPTQNVGKVLGEILHNLQIRAVYKQMAGYSPEEN